MEKEQGRSLEHVVESVQDSLDADFAGLRRLVPIVDGGEKDAVSHPVVTKVRLGRGGRVSADGTGAPDAMVSARVDNVGIFYGKIHAAWTVRDASRMAPLGVDLVKEMILAAAAGAVEHLTMVALFGEHGDIGLLNQTQVATVQAKRLRKMTVSDLEDFIGEAVDYFDAPVSLYLPKKQWSRVKRRVWSKFTGSGSLSKIPSGKRMVLAVAGRDSMEMHVPQPPKISILREDDYGGEVNVDYLYGVLMVKNNADMLYYDGV